MRNYTIPQDQMQRYHGTIVQFDGQPVYVMVAGNKWNLYKPSTINIGNNVLLFKGIDPYDERVDVSSLPMGYVNLSKWKTVRYLVRRPVKKFQQGMNPEVLGVHQLPDFKNEFYVDPNSILYTQEFEDCVLGKYPNLKEALETLENQVEDCGEIAIDRSIALSVDKLGIIKAYYRNSLVGWMAPGKKVLNVPSSNMGWVVSHHLSGLDWEIN